MLSHLFCSFKRTKAEKEKAKKVEFLHQLFDKIDENQNNKLLNDGLEQLKTNLRKQKGLSMRDQINFKLDPLKALAGGVFLGIFEHV